MTGKIVLGAAIVFLVLLAFLVIALIISPKSIEEQEAERKLEMQRANIKVSFSERLVMVGTAFLFLGLPCILILAAMAALAMLLFGLL